jgi:PAS domain S-box-containing protein
MNLEQAHASADAVFHCYELYWWCGLCGLLLITIFFLLRSRRTQKDAQQLQAAQTALRQELQEQKAALKQATKREALFQQAVAILPDAVIITEASGDIQYCNSVAQQDTEYTADELLSQPISLLLPESVVSQQQIETTIRVKKKDGTEYPASAFVTVLRDQEEKILGILFLLKDKSIHQQRKQAQAAEHNKLLARLSKARQLETIGMMTGEVAHDLNNILSSTLHHPEQLLRNLPEDNPLRPSLASIHRSGQQAVALVADLLSAAKTGSAVKEITDLNKLVQEFLTGREQQDLFTKRVGISLRTRLYPDALPVNCSPSHIRQCLYNLLLNSCDAIHAGGPVGTVTVSLDSRYLAEPPPAGLQLRFRRICCSFCGRYRLQSVCC